MTNFRKLQNEELNRISTEAFKKAPKLPVVILLDHVRSQNNVGSVFRTSDAFRIEKIFLCGITSTPENREVHKTALGAEDAVDWEYVKDTTEAVDRLKKEGYRIFAIEQAENTTSLENFSLSPGQKYALIFGNEGQGSATRGNRSVRRLYRDSPIRDETLFQYLGDCRDRPLANHRSSSGNPENRLKAPKADRRSYTLRS